MNIFPDYNVMKSAPKQNIKDQTATDYWLEKGNYVNFDYVTLGWNVPLTRRLPVIVPLFTMRGYMGCNSPSPFGLGFLWKSYSAAIVVLFF